MNFVACGLGVSALARLGVPPPRFRVVANRIPAPTIATTASAISTASSVLRDRGGATWVPLSGRAGAGRGRGCEPSQPPSSVVAPDPGEPGGAGGQLDSGMSGRVPATVSAEVGPAQLAGGTGKGAGGAWPRLGTEGGCGVVVGGTAYTLGTAGTGRLEAGWPA